MSDQETLVIHLVSAHHFASRPTLHPSGVSVACLCEVNRCRFTTVVFCYEFLEQWLIDIRVYRVGLG